MLVRTGRSQQAPRSVPAYVDTHSPYPWRGRVLTDCSGLCGHLALRTRPRSPTPLHRPSHKPRHPPGTCLGHRSVGPAVSPASRRTCPGHWRRTPRRPSRARSRRTGHVSGERSQIPTRPGRAGGSELAGRLPTSRVCAGQDTGAPPFSRQTSTVLTTNKYRSRGERGGRGGRAHRACEVLGRRRPVRSR